MVQAAIRLDSLVSSDRSRRANIRIEFFHSHPRSFKIYKNGFIKVHIVLFFKVQVGDFLSGQVILLTSVSTGFSAVCSQSCT